MAVLAGKAVNLVFNRRAVAWPDAFDDAGIHRRTVEVGANDVVRPFVGAGDPAGQLFRVEFRVAKQREYRQRIVRVLLCHHRKVDGFAVKAWGRSCLQATGGQLQFAQTRGERNGGHVAHATAGGVC